jgi:hypothetical protein
MPPRSLYLGKKRVNVGKVDDLLDLRLLSQVVGRSSVALGGGTASALVHGSSTHLYRSGLTTSAIRGRLSFGSPGREVVRKGIESRRTCRCLVEQSVQGFVRTVAAKALRSCGEQGGECFAFPGGT